jgi:hypothetical protein
MLFVENVEFGGDKPDIYKAELYGLMKKTGALPDEKIR